MRFFTTCSPNSHQRRTSLKWILASPTQLVLAWLTTSPAPIGSCSRVSGRAGSNPMNQSPSDPMHPTKLLKTISACAVRINTIWFGCTKSVLQATVLVRTTLRMNLSTTTPSKFEFRFRHAPMERARRRAMVNSMRITQGSTPQYLRWGLSAHRHPTPNSNWQVAHHHKDPTQNTRCPDNSLASAQSFDCQLGNNVRRR